MNHDTQTAINKTLTCVLAGAIIANVVLAFHQSHLHWSHTLTYSFGDTMLSETPMAPLMDSSALQPTLEELNAMSHPVPKKKPIQQVIDHGGIHIN